MQGHVGGERDRAWVPTEAGPSEGALEAAAGGPWEWWPWASTGTEGPYQRPPKPDCAVEGDKHTLCPRPPQQQHRAECTAKPLETLINQRTWNAHFSTSPDWIPRGGKLINFRPSFLLYSDHRSRALRVRGELLLGMKTKRTQEGEGNADRVRMARGHTTVQGGPQESRAEVGTGEENGAPL